MFEFFKDVVSEAKGEDQEVYRSRKADRAMRSKVRINKGIKVTIILVGIVYLVLSATNISYIIRNDLPFYNLLKYIFLSVLIIAINVSLFLKSEKAKYFTIVGCITFFILNYIFTFGGIING